MNLSISLFTVAFAIVVGSISLATPARTQVAGSVEAGLAQLAQQIVAKSTAADRTTIAVLPFPHAEGSCSVLSTYIVDELILSLFSVPDSKLDIVERAQLEALITELKMSEGGLLNPETTKQLGNLSGVSALTMGTITVIGDSVRLNARLVATDTGRTISAAAVTVPRTQTLNDLISRPVTSGLTCGGFQAATPVPDPAGAASAAASTSPSSTRSASYPQQVESTDHAQVFVEGIKGTVTTAGKSEDGKYLTIALQVENTTKRDLRIGLIGPEPAALDNTGGVYKLKTFSGSGQCQNLHPSAQSECLKMTDWLPPNAYSELSPGAKTTLVFSFYSGSGSAGDIVSFSSTFALLEVVPATGGNKEQQMKLSTIGIGVPNITIMEKG
jgi:TolB-like protein